MVGCTCLLFCGDMTVTRQVKRELMFFQENVHENRETLLMLQKLGNQHQQVAQSLHGELMEHHERLEELKRESAERRDSHRKRMKEMIDKYKREVKGREGQAQEVRRWKEMGEGSGRGG
eukprot:760103-Hanusia_phi.AAC.1